MDGAAPVLPSVPGAGRGVVTALGRDPGDGVALPGAVLVPALPGLGVPMELPVEPELPAEPPD